MTNLRVLPLFCSLEQRGGHQALELLDPAPIEDRFAEDSPLEQAGFEH
jgi:hypothetical protein